MHAMRIWLAVLLICGFALLLGPPGYAATQTATIPYSMVLRVLGTDRYEIEVDNMNTERFIDNVAWTPPSGMSVKSVIRSVNGKCDVSEGLIKCSTTLDPATCACAGSFMLVDFTATGREPTFANGYWTHYGIVGSISVSGKSAAKASAFGDLPTCKKGQKSTSAHPCATG